MKARIVVFCFYVVVLAFTAGSSLAQKSGQAAAGPAADEMKRALMDAAPGPSHQQLAKRVGKYTTVTRFVPQPGATAMESSGTSRISLVLDGRFLLEEDSATFMGQASSGLRLWGYNNATKRYEACWTYTMSTAILTLTGTTGDAGKTVTFAGGYDDENGVKQMLKVVTRQLDNDRFVVELTAQTPDGKDGATLTTTYTRTK